MKSIPVVAIIAGAILAFPSTAATVVFDAEVSRLPSEARVQLFEEDYEVTIAPFLPPVGTVGTVTVEVRDDLLGEEVPDTGLDLPFDAIVASVDIPGFLTGSVFIDTFFGIFLTDDELFIASDGGSELTGSPVISDGTNTITLTFADDVGPLTTYGDLFAAIAAPGTSGVFEADIGTFFDTLDIEIDILPNDIALAPVPLPASAFLLAGGLLGLGLMRRRSQSAESAS